MKVTSSCVVQEASERSNAAEGAPARSFIRGATTGTQDGCDLALVERPTYPSSPVATSVRNNSFLKQVGWGGTARTADARFGNQGPAAYGHSKLTFSPFSTDTNVSLNHEFTYARNQRQRHGLNANIFIPLSSTSVKPKSRSTIFLPEKGVYFNAFEL